VSAFARTKRRAVRGRIAVVLIHANDLVVGARSYVSAIGRKPDRVNGSQMVAHMTELSRLGAFLGFVDGIRGPDANVAICVSSVFSHSHTGTRTHARPIRYLGVGVPTSAGRRQSFAIGRDVTAVDLEIFLLACVGEGPLVFTADSAPQPCVIFPRTAMAQPVRLDKVHFDLVDFALVLCSCLSRDVGIFCLASDVFLGRVAQLSWVRDCAALLGKRRFRDAVHQSALKVPLG
jgi:hypothetical protein